MVSIHREAASKSSTRQQFVTRIGGIEVLNTTTMCYPYGKDWNHNFVNVQTSRCVKYLRIISSSRLQNFWINVSCVRIIVSRIMNGIDVAMIINCQIVIWLTNNYTTSKCLSQVSVSNYTSEKNPKNERLRNASVIKIIL